MINSSIPRCEVVPMSDDSVRFQIDGRHVTSWHFTEEAPRPFFYPLMGPGDTELTRMGHPGAPNHDHHRSVWFAHHKVLGIDFWGDLTDAVIRQSQWLAYEDGNEEARMGVKLLWQDGHDPSPLLQQTLLVAVIPHQQDQWILELQSTWMPNSEEIELEKTNFGMIAVRVARSISAVFGKGKLQDSHGRIGERAIFGKRAEWMDYSGPARCGGAKSERVVGVTLFDHPQNVGYPCHWHVRDDGWMGASVGFAGPIQIRKTEPLVLRYQLLVHDGDCDAKANKECLQAFANRPPLTLVTRPAPHHQFGITRTGT